MNHRYVGIIFVNTLECQMVRVALHVVGTVDEKMTKEIPLTQGKITLVDDEDYEWVIKYKWCAIKMSKYWYVVRGERSSLSKRTKIFSLHRLIINAKNNDICDHINGDGLDNRKCNLRIVTTQQNSMNAKKTQYKKSSKYKGVSWRKDNNNWDVHINNKKRFYLGSFKNEDDAGRAYDEAAKRLFGEYAKLNFAPTN